jgi:hypothetical protein
VRPRSRESRSCSANISPTCVPWTTTSAWYPWHASSFERTAPSGMITVAGTPTARAAHAQAWAALPAETVMTPARRSASPSVSIRFVIPRALNEPVFCRCSALTWSVPPARREPLAPSTILAAVADASIGVRWIRPAIRSRAASIESRLTIRSAVSTIRVSQSRIQFRAAVVTTCVFAQIVT